MRRTYGLAALVAAGALACIPGAQAQAPGPKPGPEIERLRHLEGTWDATVEVKGLPPTKGTMVYQMELGGLWLVSHFKSDSGFGGGPFTGMGLDSYDAGLKKYVSVWVDSMSTAPMVMHGDYDEASNSLTMKGKGPGQDGKLVEMKSVLKLEDKDHVTFIMTMPDGGTMTIHYKRKG